MTQKRILVADADPQMASQMAEALGSQWLVKAALAGPAAVTALDEGTFDVVVASITLPELDGPQLLNRVRQKFPDTVRILLAEESDRERVIKDGLGTQQILSKPCKAEVIRATLEKAVSRESWIPDDAVRELVSKMRSLPTIPSIYLEVRNELKAPHGSPESVGKIIGKDMAMTTKLLQVCNSSYFGLSRKITDPGEAVGLLGFDAVNSIVVAVKMLGYYDRIKPVYYSVDKLWKHSLAVAQHARKIAMRQGGDRVLAETAYTAGLMHDLGKIVLACNFSHENEGVQNTAKQQSRSLWSVEKEVFGAGHADIGAYLLGLWGLPPEVCEAAAWHHQPLRSPSEEFTVLTAVHAANALEHEINVPDEGYAVSKPDTIYLARIQCLNNMDVWREEVVGKPAPVPEEASKNPFSAAAAARKAKLEAPRPPSWFGAFVSWLASFGRAPAKPVTSHPR
jgi:putative nucleotidyltransferase with HDIG domain